MSIRKHLPPRSKDAYKCLQVKMEAAVVEEVKGYMKIDGISWNELITACFKKYLEESRTVHGELKTKISNGGAKGTTLLGIVTIISLMESPIFQAVCDFSDLLA